MIVLKGVKLREISFTDFFYCFNFLFIILVVLILILAIQILILNIILILILILILVVVLKSGRFKGVKRREINSMQSIENLQ